MPRAGWCSECAKWVWVGKGDGCVNGHPRSCLQKEFEASPDPVTNEPVAPVLYPQVTPSPRNLGDAVSAVGKGVTSYVGAVGRSLSVKADEMSLRNSEAANEIRSRRDSQMPQPIPVGVRNEPPMTGSKPSRLYAVTSASTKVTGKRIGAYVIDMVFLWIATFILYFPVASFQYTYTAMSDGEIDALARLLALVVWIGYFTLCEFLWGQTVGKRLLGIRVVSKEGLPITVGQSLGRNAARFIDFMLWGIPAFATMAGSPIHQRLGDAWAKSAVVSTALAEAELETALP